MSNHDGSYMLNEVLETLVDLGIDAKIGKETTLAFVFVKRKIPHMFTEKSPT
ncbi:MAG: hypothetical protein OWQ59_02610 [Alicyclobacillaceae bacterium]|uniref:hypothetical protein n=1 Tax=Alicyclobacillus sp. SP_1 TaxID=2942475 RepID=UPI0021584266|nr:hypothetical protein [Alicyclobacillus sp. SP_1]MCY0887326.1 hypothetical protein [Alicyclobacillaceae bacterium]